MLLICVCVHGQNLTIFVYSKTCLTWTQAYTDTQSTLDKILCTDRFLSIYLLTHGQTCHVWMVDTKKCTKETKLPLIYMDT